MAAEAIRRSGVRLRGNLVIACVAGETQGGEGTHYLMESGLRTDAAVVAEPFGADNLVTVHSGIVLYPTYTSRGNAVVPTAVAIMGVALYTVLRPGARRARLVAVDAVDRKAGPGAA